MNVKFYTGDKIVCINNYSNRFSSYDIPFDVIKEESVLPLTVGRVYEVIYDSEGYTHLTNDNGTINFYLSERFIGMAEYRKGIIEDILD